MKKIALLLLTMLMVTAAQAQRRTDSFTTPSGKTVKITAIKHASILIQYEGKEIHVDPVADLIKPVTDYSQFSKAHIILITHEHPDHFDREAIVQLRQTTTVIYEPVSVYNRWLNGFAMNNGDSVSIAADIQLKAVPAYNTTPGREQMHPRFRDNGYVLTLDGLRIYIAGDTEDVPEMAQLGPIDIAFLPCTQPYTMTVEQLVKAAQVIKPRVLYPYHYSETPISKVPLLLSGSGIDVRIRDFK